MRIVSDVTLLVDVAELTLHLLKLRKNGAGLYINSLVLALDNSNLIVSRFPDHTVELIHNVTLLKT